MWATAMARSNSFHPRRPKARIPRDRPSLGRLLGEVNGSRRRAIEKKTAGWGILRQDAGCIRDPNRLVPGEPCAARLAFAGEGVRSSSRRAMDVLDDHGRTTGRIDAEKSGLTLQRQRSWLICLGGRVIAKPRDRISVPSEELAPPGRSRRFRLPSKPARNAACRDNDIQGDQAGAGDDRMWSGEVERDVIPHSIRPLTTVQRAPGTFPKFSTLYPLQSMCASPMSSRGFNS